MGTTLTRFGQNDPHPMPRPGGSFGVVRHELDGSFSYQSLFGDQQNLATIHAMAAASDGFETTFCRTVVTDDYEYAVEKRVDISTPDRVKALVRYKADLQTIIMWDALDPAQRLEHCILHQLDRATMLSSNMMMVLPRTTKGYLEEWQRLINTGAPSRLPHLVGKTADTLISAGYLLRSRKPRGTGDGMVTHSRKTVPRGSPGGIHYVRSVMGPEYAHWLDQLR